MNTFQWIDSQTTERLLEDIHRANAGEFEMIDIANAPLLDGYKAVVGHAYALSGIVSGHPRLREGKEIVTSQLFFLDAERGIARTMNRWYRLAGRARGRGN
ncbi:hypothetical protein FZ934_08630 [Rhizobium grahamii]|uniref:Uncharacterized protein n=1 Tax=Rhizobium grahamii TaxID=1120045 RepID=A0A5Q0C9Y7_9HYPH|nr:MULTISPECIES: DUF6634 family protein [Rhizobium]QFY60489.1 hypothetical protein FZ934_08630 [Rhizobium grahamii]QRM50383.1 hypothetical protein F3Y33_14260 [Rhizobium sp. BG6]